MATDQAPDGPRLTIEPVSVQAAAPPRWQVAWRIENRTDGPVEIVEAWIPHGRFRAEEQRDGLARQIGPGGSELLERRVLFEEPPGTVVENAFLVLRLNWRGRAWRMFARHRVEAGPSGAPRPICELITSQPVGFSA